MQIVHVITTIERGGAENQLALLARLQVESGKDVRIVFLKGKDQLRESLETCGVKLLNLVDKSFIEQIIIIRKLFMEDTIYHSHLPRAELLVRIASMGLRINWVVSRHNSERFWPRAPKIISKILSRFVTNKAGAIVCISNEVLRYSVVTREVRKSSLHKLRVVLYGRDVPTGSDVSPRHTDRFNFKLGVAARFEKQKDFPTLFRAFAKVLEESTNDWTLKIAGSGSLEAMLKHDVIEMKIDSRVRWLGKIEEMKQFYNDIDIFILPSKYEGFGLVLLEAISYQIPIISSDIATSREILGEDYPGLFPVGNPDALASKILELNDISLREACITTYSVNLKRFDAIEMEKQISEIYLSCS